MKVKGAEAAEQREVFPSCSEMQSRCDRSLSLKALRTRCAELSRLSKLTELTKAKCVHVIKCIIIPWYDLVPQKSTEMQEQKRDKSYRRKWNSASLLGGLVVVNKHRADMLVGDTA